MIGVQASPYPGLRAFTREESYLFFGRTGCVTDMVDKLAASRFLSVLGASGSGKSSLVRTGLLDALELGIHPKGANWLIADMHPAGAPIRELARALLSCDGDAPDDVQVDMLAAGLRRGPRSIIEWWNARPRPGGQNLLILVDQFEELFRYADLAGREEAEGFARLLLESARDPDAPISICLTMRSEYLGACAMIPGLAERINEGLYLAPRMTREEFREAIEGPAGICGFSIEPELVNTLLNDVAALAPWDADAQTDQLQRLAQRADQLPLMQHLLNRLWLKAKDKDPVVLRQADYDDLGGLRGALNAHGQEVMDRLGPAREPAAQRVFRALVDGATLATAVRRPIYFAKLATAAGDRRAAEAVVEAFRAPDCNFLQPPSHQRLTDQTIVDISHESLIRQWDRLAGWLAEEAEAGAAWRRLLDAQQRHAAGRSNLLSGLSLANDAAWWRHENPTPDWAERHGGQFQAVDDFFKASLAEEERVRAEANLRQTLEKRRLRQGLYTSVALGLLAAAGGAVGWANYDEASRAKGAAERVTQDLRDAKRSLEATNRNLALSLQSQQAAKARADAAAARADEAARAAAAAARAAEAKEREARGLADTQRRMLDEIGKIADDETLSLDPNGRPMQLAVSRVTGKPPPPSSLGQNDVEVGSRVRSHVAKWLIDYYQEAIRRRNLEASDVDLIRISTLRRLADAYESTGEPTAAMNSLKEAWRFAQDAAQRRGWRTLDGEDKDPALRREILQAGLNVAWTGYLVGDEDASAQALEQVRQFVANFSVDMPEMRADSGLALLLSQYENLESAVSSERTVNLPLSAPADAPNGMAKKPGAPPPRVAEASVPLISPLLRGLLQRRAGGEEPAQAQGAPNKAAEPALEESDPLAPEPRRMSFPDLTKAREHNLLSIKFGELAAAAPDASQRALTRLAVNYSNNSDKEVTARVCGLARDLEARSKSRLDLAALRARETCADRMLTDDAEHLGDAADKALDALSAAIAIDPGDTDLRAQRSELAFDYAKYLFAYGRPGDTPLGDGDDASVDGAAAAASRRAELNALGYGDFIAMLKERRVPAARRELTWRIESVDAEHEVEDGLVAERLENILRALEPLAPDLGRSRDFADAWREANQRRAQRLMKLSSDAEPDRIEQIKASYDAALARFPADVFPPRPQFQQEYTDYCNTAHARLVFLMDQERAADALAAVHDLKARCQSYLEAVPAVLWMRFAVIGGYELLAPLATTAEWSAKARPYLEYASRWGSRRATTALLDAAGGGLWPAEDSEIQALRRRQALQETYGWSYQYWNGSAYISWSTTLIQTPSSSAPVAKLMTREYERLGIKVEPNAIAFLEKSEALSRRIGASFPRLTRLIDEAASERIGSDDLAAKNAEALRLLDFPDSRVPMNADGVAFGGYDPYSIWKMEPVKGEPDLLFYEGGALVRYASLDNYASGSEGSTWPAYNGYDALALARGEWTAADPRVAARRGKRIFLFATEQNRADWLKSQRAFVRRADAAWRGRFPSPPATDVIESAQRPSGADR
jgi:hypothetical protein